jgi:anti-sigma factor ChrR (cupin superfamily)
MTDHLSFEQLCDLADGACSPAAETTARTHLRACEECTSRLSAITALAASTAALPQEMAPPADLWDDIRKDLQPRHMLRRRRGPMWQWRHLAAAAVIIAIASSALTALVLRDRHVEVATAELPGAQAPTPATQVQLPAPLASAEHGYTRSVQTLQRVLDERRDSLAPSTIATVERSLRIADSAIAEARDALARDPANRALAALFASNYERKIDLLRRATELAPRT